MVKTSLELTSPEKNENVQKIKFFKKLSLGVTVT